MEDAQRREGTTQGGHEAGRMAWEELEPDPRDLQAAMGQVRQGHNSSRRWCLA